jgi:hypothetical protein
MLYKFTTKEGKEIEVPREPWQWEIGYKDKSELKQFDDEGFFHQVGEIKQDEIAVARFTNGIMCIDIPWIEGMRLIHKYRNFMLNVGTDEETKIRVYIFGYKYKDQYHFNFITPNGVIIQGPVDRTLV